MACDEGCPCSMPDRRTLLKGFSAVAVTALFGCSSRPTTIGAYYHEVVAGENLSEIAALYNIPLADLLAVNGLRDSQLIAGQRLNLPAHARKTPPQAKPQPAVIAAAGPQMHPRVAWQAPDPGANWEPMGAVRWITLHHTDEHAGISGLPDLEVVNAICRYHRSLGWADIGYHFLIGREGRVIEGRRPDRQGAHSGGEANRNNLGVSLIGNFHLKEPSSKQLAGLRVLLETLRRHYRLPLDRVRAHRDWKPTECPGDALYGWLQRYQRGQA